MSSDRQHAQALRRLEALYRSYSLSDITASVYAMALWLPNISAFCKMQFLVAPLLATKRAPQARHATRDAITSYADFGVFSEQVLALLPDFPETEDYVPIPDWGETRYWLGKRSYRYLYSTPLAWSYDLLRAIHLARFSLPSRKYEDIARNSASDELHFLLDLHDSLVASVTTQPEGYSLQVRPGEVACPPEAFWSEASKWYSGARQRFDRFRELLRPYSRQLGSMPRTQLSDRRQFSVPFEGNETIERCWAIDDGTHLYPVLPRHNLSGYCHRWADFGRYAPHSETEATDGAAKAYQEVAPRLARFISQRIHPLDFFRYAQVLDGDAQPVGPLFQAAIPAQHRLLLIHVPDPAKYLLESPEDWARLFDDYRRADAAFVEHSCLGLVLDNQRVVLKRSTTALPPLITHILILPRAPNQMVLIQRPDDVRFSVFSVGEFVGFIDQIDPADLASFYDFWEENDEALSMLATAIDILAFFHNTHGVVTTGAVDYTSMFIDLGLGESLRYDTLRTFWSLYPQAGFFDDPRTWRMERESETRLRLISRREFFFALHCTIGRSSVFFSSPFLKLGREEGHRANFLMECLEDASSRNNDILRAHSFFSKGYQLHVHVFPRKAVLADAELEHLHALAKSMDPWPWDAAWLAPTELAVRLVFDEQGVLDTFTDPVDSTAEIAVVTVLLNAVEAHCPDAGTPAILTRLQERRARRPRFSFTSRDRRVTFPDGVDPYLPEEGDRRRAARDISRLAQSLGIAEGTYSEDAGRLLLNSLKEALVDRISTQLRAYDATSLSYLIERHEALLHTHFRQDFAIEIARTLDIDYDLTARHAEARGERVRTVAVTRYLIERSAMLTPTGEVSPAADDFRHLSALASKLLELYHQSDLLKYRLQGLSVEVDSEHRVRIVLPPAAAHRANTFGTRLSGVHLGTTATPSDSVQGTEDVERLYDRLDEAFQEDCGFCFRTLLRVLDVLSNWNAVAHIDAPVPTHRATIAAVAAEVAARHAILPTECELALSFLVLPPTQVGRITGEPEIALDVPIWEKKKRPWRYSLRPLLRSGSDVIWGPYSAYEAAMIWIRYVLAGAPPFSDIGMHIASTVARHKQHLEKLLVMKVEEVALRETRYVRRDLKLHKVDRSGGHPPELGDYDTLAYFPDSCLLLNIECKDLGEAFCARDVLSLQEKIFGAKLGKLSSHDKVVRRATYLRKNGERIIAALGWPVPSTAPRIQSLWLSRNLHWSIAFPPVTTDVGFLVPEELQHYIRQRLQS